ncbi:MAG TPA: hypothetical protein PLJ04_00770 [Candidatus Saccharibacteria bacterium]|nr:hypothetical protein [Candidatus Saccharibacteria bacterium]HPR10092.1 hypothetical protein [Candidatus Saccharibacteria bacterium]
MTYNRLAQLTTAVIGSGILLIMVAVTAFAQVENPQNGGIGLQGKISSPPPSSAPTISTPGNGQVISTIPIEVRGICTGNLLVKLYKNNVFSGSDQCRNGSYSITIDLFSGRNELVARHVDELDQQGPDSNVVAITFNDGASRPNLAERITVTSSYARRGANPTETLSWPIVITGGTAPYALSVDWGDGSQADVYSITIPGEFTIKHVFKQAGVYRALIKATDKNGNVGFLQLTAIANGEIKQADVAGAVESGRTITKVLWQPVVLAIPFVITTFYLGKKYEVTRIKQKLSKGEHPFD